METQTLTSTHIVKNTETQTHRHMLVNTICGLLGPKGSSGAIQGTVLSYRDHRHRLLSVNRKHLLSESGPVQGHNTDILYTSSSPVPAARQSTNTQPLGEGLQASGGSYRISLPPQNSLLAGAVPRVPSAGPGRGGMGTLCRAGSLEGEEGLLNWQG